jgi:hypothetical protein
MMEKENKNSDSILHLEATNMPNPISNLAMITLVDKYNRMPFANFTLDSTKPITQLEIDNLCQSKIDEYLESDDPVSRDDLEVIAYTWGKLNIVPSTNDEGHPGNQIN